jgi:DNA invertase Pin-like site-specific DNA recombinase
MTNTPLKVAVYERVSRAHQSTGLQTDETGGFVERRGWTLWKRYVDHGVSGARDRRPALDQMLADARARKFDAIVVYKTDRMARSLKNLVTMLDELASYGVGYVSISEPFDTTSPAGKLVCQVVGAMAEFERSLNADRTRLGIAAARRRGVRVGRPRARVDLEHAIRDAAKILGVGAATLSRSLSSAASGR